MVDLSVAAITNGQILMAMADGKPIPEGCALGPDGRPATDPETARKGAVLPFGGHKGYALAVMIQIFSGVLVRGAPVPEPGVNYGIFMLAISPSVFLKRELFEAGVGELIDRIKSARRAEGVGEILLPGERAFQERAFRLREGIDMDEALWRKLERLLS